MMQTSCASQLTLDEAHAIVRARSRPLRSEHVPIARAGSRVLAEPVVSRIDSPAADVAAMDGFAVSDAAIRAGIRSFRVIGKAYTGHACDHLAAPGEAIRIMTGAIMPPPVDRVIPFELASERDDVATMADPIPEALHVRAKASDFREGQILLGRGTVLNPAGLLVAAASDQPTVCVHARPRLRVIASGDELAVPGSAASGRACIPDSLTNALLLLGQSWGADPVAAAIMPDDAKVIETAVAAACGDTDILVLAGGASHGDRDLARPALMSLGLEPGFAGIAVKPGKPAWYGRIGDTHVIGVPGNPSAAMIIARLFLAPLICALTGRGFDAGLAWSTLPLGGPVSAAGDRETILLGHGDGAHVDIIERQSASAQLPLAVANTLVRRPAAAPALPRGAPVAVLAL